VNVGFIAIRCDVTNAHDLVEILEVDEFLVGYSSVAYNGG